MSTGAHRLGGMKARSNGETFEALIDNVCRRYKAQGKAYILKTPEPMKPLRPSGRPGQFVACYTKQAQPDYKGTLSGGRAVCFEAKHTATARIEQNRVTAEQAAALTLHERLGAACFVLVSVQFKRFYRVPWAVWSDMPGHFGKVSMNEDDLAPYAVEIGEFLNNLGDL